MAGQQNRPKAKATVRMTKDVNRVSQLRTVRPGATSAGPVSGFVGMCALPFRGIADSIKRVEEFPLKRHSQERTQFADLKKRSQFRMAFTREYVRVLDWKVA